MVLLCDKILDILFCLLLFVVRIPVRTFFDGLDIGPIAVAMSSDVQYVATISAGPLQVLSLTVS